MGKNLIALAVGVVAASAIVYYKMKPDEPAAAGPPARAEASAATAEAPPASSPSTPIAEARPVAPPASKPKAAARETRASAPAPQPAASPAPATAAESTPPPPPPASAAPEPSTPPPPMKVEPPPPRQPRSVTIPAGTLFPARLSEALVSDRMKAGDTFAATLDAPVVVDDLVIAERGARVEGVIVEATEAGRVQGLAALVIQMTSFQGADGQKVAVKTESFRKEAEKSTKEDAAKIGAAAAIGAAIGAIAGGGKGAAIGAGAGGAAGTGGVLATRGKPAELPVETRISFKLATPVTVTERLR